jgi:taurine transport system permease protein
MSEFTQTGRGGHRYACRPAEARQDEGLRRRREADRADQHRHGVGASRRLVARRQAGACAAPLPADAHEVWTQIGAIYRDGYAGASLFEHISASLFRIITAAAIATVVGIPVGLLMGLNRWVKGVLDTPDRVLLATAAACLPAADDHLARHRRDLEGDAAGAGDVRAHLPVGPGRRPLVADRARQCRAIAGCQAVAAAVEHRPAIGAAGNPHRSRIALGIGWGTLVAAELIASTRGIGFMIMSASQFLATDVVFVGIGIIAACAFAFSAAIRMLEAVLVPWKGKS